MSSRLRPFVVTNTHNKGAPLDHSAAIELADTDRGFLPNRLTTAQRDAIPDPAPGLLIYNTSDSVYQFFDGATWQGIGGGGSNSGLALISNGTITTPVSLLDITLPADYLGPFYLELSKFVLDTSDNLCGVWGRTDGEVITFYADPDNSDTYGEATGIAPAIFNLKLFFFGDFLVGTVDCSAVLNPGSGSDTPRIRIHATNIAADFSAVHDQISTSFLNPNATIPPEAGRVNLIRILPYGFGDVDPPTSGEMITAGSWALLGVPTL